MVQAAEADIIGPAVTTDDPDILADQFVSQAEQVFGFPAFLPWQSSGAGVSIRASLFVQTGFVSLICVNDFVN